MLKDTFVLIPARRPGKLPPETVTARYLLEYGENALEVNADAIAVGARVVIHDDVLATGGTVEAIAGLVEQLGGHVVGVNFVIELSGGKAFEEDEWIGRQVRIGDTLCEIVAPSTECLAVSFHPEKPAGDISMIEGLLKVRSGAVGLQVRVARGQRIRVSDTVSLVD